MAVIKFWRGTFEQFTNLTNKDENTVYVVKDNDSTKNGIYLGSEQVATVSESLSDEEIEQIVNDAIQGKADKYRATIEKTFTLADVRVGDDLRGKVFLFPSWGDVDTSDWADCGSSMLGVNELSYIKFENSNYLGAAISNGFESFGITDYNNLEVDDRFRITPFYCAYSGTEYYTPLSSYTFPDEDGWVVSYIPVEFPQVMHDTINNSNSYMIEVDIDPEYNYNSNVFLASKGVGSIELKPYMGTDSSGNPVLVSTFGASGEGAFALGKEADARGKRSRVFGSKCMTTEEAWDAFVIGQRCRSSASGNLTGGIRSVNNGNYGITFGSDCTTGKNVRALNVGMSNTMLENSADDYGFRFAIGTGLFIGNVKYKSALGQYNVGHSDAIFEYGCGTSGSNRKNAFDIVSSGSIRQYGNKWFINKTSNGNGVVVISTDAIPVGTQAYVQLPTESGKIALESSIDEVKTAIGDLSEFDEFSVSHQLTTLSIDLHTIENSINNKVDKTTSAYKVYATDYRGNTIALPWGYVASGAGIIPVRDTGGNIIVPLTPSSDEFAASKKYVDDLVANASGGGGGSAKLYRHIIRCSVTNYTIEFKIISSQSTPYEDSMGINLFYDNREKLPIPVMIYDSSGYNPVAIGMIYDTRGRIFALDNQGAFISIKYDDGSSNLVDTITEV